jgi:WD40 repeat protein
MPNPSLIGREPITAANAHRVRQIASLDIPANDNPEDWQRDLRFVTQVEFSLDSKQLAFGGFDSSIHLLDLETQTVRRMSPDHISEYNGGITSLVFSPDGRTIAAGASYGMIGLWDVASGLRTAMLGEQHGVKNYVRDLVFSPDGRFLGASEPYGKVRLYQLEPFRELKPEISDEYVFNLDISPDSKVVAGLSVVGKLSAENQRVRINLWSLPELDTIREVVIPLNFDVMYVKFTSDSQTLLIAGYSDLWVWNWANGEPQAMFIRNESRESNFREFSFSADGTLMAHTFPGGTIWIWELATRTRVATLKEEPVAEHPNIHPGNYSRLMFAKHDALLVHSGKGPLLALWDARTRQNVGVIDPTFDPMGQIVAISPDGSLIAVAKHTIKLWGVD